jgi:2-polyprenyl-3-methyl-5-hydroxy-6-metoxy-1,4-benzoquinol methylase
MGVLEVHGQVMNLLNDEQIIEAWHRNARPWIAAVQQDRIESRRLVTNRAILETVTALDVQSVLDIGCGEGWLVRQLSAVGLRVAGLDVVPDLLEQARRLGPERYYLTAYELLSACNPADCFDLALCNFSLLGKESVEHLFDVLPGLLNPGGYFVMQTLHPATAEGVSVDGWRPGSWAGIEGDFAEPAPWYFRSTASWLQLFEQAGLNLVECREPVNPVTEQVASLILVGRL